MEGCNYCNSNSDCPVLNKGECPVRKMWLNNYREESLVKLMERVDRQNKLYLLTSAMSLPFLCVEEKRITAN